MRDIYPPTHQVYKQMAMAQNDLDPRMEYSENIICGFYWCPPNRGIFAIWRYWIQQGGATQLDIVGLFVRLYSLWKYLWKYLFIIESDTSTAQGGGGSFKNRKPIGEVGCCESRIAERIHWWTERWLELCFLEWLQWLQWSPHPGCSVV